MLLVTLLGLIWNLLVWKKIARSCLRTLLYYLLSLGPNVVDSVCYGRAQPCTRTFYVPYHYPAFLFILFSYPALAEGEERDVRFKQFTVVHCQLCIKSIQLHYLHPVCALPLISTNAAKESTQRERLVSATACRHVHYLCCSRPGGRTHRQTQSGYLPSRCGRTQAAGVFPERTRGRDGGRCLGGRRPPAQTL